MKYLCNFFVIYFLVLVFGEFYLIEKNSKYWKTFSKYGRLGLSTMVIGVFLYSLKEWIF